VVVGNYICGCGSRNYFDWMYQNSRPLGTRSILDTKRKTERISPPTCLIAKQPTPICDVVLETILNAPTHILAASVTQPVISVAISGLYPIHQDFPAAASIQSIHPILK